ncbi:transposase, partial [Hymenobacter profundi]|nr:transposase [Hymenobacter profundi]
MPGLPAQSYLRTEGRLQATRALGLQWGLSTGLAPTAQPARPAHAPRVAEPVFGNLLQQYGLRRVGTKGRAAAHKTMLLSAIAYNLKKLLKHLPKRVVSLAL